MKVLVVSPHPDDETLGAGGTILRFKKEGHEVFWLNVTDMKTEYGYSAKQVRTRQLEIEKVRKTYSFDGFYNLGLKPCSLLEHPRTELVGQVAKILGKVKPGVVILPFRNDPHSDHRVVFEAIYSCLKTFRAPFVKEILMMEILSETEFASSDDGFVPNYFVDISAQMEKKLSIVKNYKKELGKHPFPRNILNIRALATFRGASVGCQFAESFILLKKVV